MITPPPRSTLLPITTLFRSRVVASHRAEVPGHRPREVDLAAAVTARQGRQPGVGRRPGELAGVGTGAAGIVCLRQPAPRDRKSTRLNSSHDQISYAVFCLKK